MRILTADQPALAVVELASIARGVVVLDQMAKRVKTQIVAARTFSPGRYLIMVTGEVAEVSEAVDAALLTAAEDLIDHAILHDPHSELRKALAERLDPEMAESLLIVETSTVSSVILFSDRALKESDVALIELRLGAGLSGKGVVTLTGTLDMVEAARDVAHAAIAEASRVRVELIAQPHPDLPFHLLGAEPALSRGPRHPKSG